MVLLEPPSWERSARLWYLGGVVEAVVSFEDGQDPSDDRAVLAVRLKAPDGGTETVERL